MYLLYQFGMLPCVRQFIIIISLNCWSLSLPALVSLLVLNRTGRQSSTIDYHIPHHMACVGNIPTVATLVKLNNGVHFYITLLIKNLGFIGYQ